MQKQIDLINLKELLRKVFCHASLIVAGNTIRVSYECIEGDIIDEFIENRLGEFNELEVFKHALIQADGVELYAAKRGDKFCANLMLTYNMGRNHRKEISISLPTEKRKVFSEVMTELKENPPRGNSDIEPYVFSPEFKFHLDEEEYIKREIGRIFEWIDARAEKRTILNLPKMSRWNEMQKEIWAVPVGAEVEVLEPRTIEDTNRASTSWLFDFEGDITFSTVFNLEQKNAFVKLLEISDDFGIEIALNDGYSGMGFTFGINDIMV